jgi:uncharacterized protein
VLKFETPKAKTVLRVLQRDPTVAFAQTSAPRKLLSNAPAKPTGRSSVSGQADAAGRCAARRL